jgi:hypothetical protein
MQMVSSSLTLCSTVCYIVVLPFYLQVQIVVEARVKLKCKLLSIVGVKYPERKFVSYSASVSSEEGRT